MRFWLLGCVLALLCTQASAEDRTSIYSGFYDATPDGGTYLGLAFGSDLQFNEIEYGRNRDIDQVAVYSTYQVPLWRDYFHALLGIGFANFIQDDDDFWERLTPDVALIKGGVNLKLFGPVYAEALMENSYFGKERADYKLQVRWNF